MTIESLRDIGIANYHVSPFTTKQIATRYWRSQLRNFAMNFLKIQNVGECQIEGFTKLGLSTARGNSDKIGQFGSGTKMGVLCLLRHGINPTIFAGKDKIEFFTEKGRFDGTTYDKVFVSVNNRKPQETSLTLQYGALDWHTPTMGVREFISNAIDQGEYKVEIVEENQVRAKQNHTSVFIPLDNEEVLGYVQALPFFFLQFNTLLSRKESAPFSKLIPNTKARAYRKGVFVREFGDENSLFDYDFGDELQIDDCRNSDNYRCQFAAARVLAKTFHCLPKLFKAIVAKEKYAELSFSKYAMLESAHSEDCQENWKKQWNSIYPDSVIVPSDVFPFFADRLNSKGIRAIAIDPYWYEILENYGIPTYTQADSQIGQKGIINENVLTEHECLIMAVWDILKKEGLTANKPMPKYSTFRAFNRGGEVEGYYKNGEIFINEDYCSVNTVLHELIHYITEATDCSNDFQEFAIKVAAHFLMPSAYPR